MQGPGNPSALEGVEGMNSFQSDPSDGSSQSRVWGFFYGGLINPVVMQRVGLHPSARCLAVLPGFDLTIAPWVNLVPRPGSLSYGLLLEVRHEELDHVYGQLKAPYRPMPVVAYQLDGLLRPALCYMVPQMPEGPAEAAHIEPLIQSGEELGFPDWYLRKIRSFLPNV